MADENCTEDIMEEGKSKREKKGEGRGKNVYSIIIDVIW